MTEHTRGPWYTGCFVRPDSRCQCTSILDEGHAGGIAEIYVNNGIKSISDGGNDCPEKAQAVANAHLICAAPEMFDAMVEFCQRVDHGEIRSKATYAKFKAILSKASPSLNLKRMRGIAA